MATKVGHILVTEYVYGGPGSGDAPEALRGSRERGIPTDDAQFEAIASDDPKAADGVNAIVTYRNDQTGQKIYTNETVAQLVAQSNGTLSAS